MRYLHTMIRVKDLEQTVDFFCELLGFKEVGRKENQEGRFTLVFLAAPNDTAATADLKSPLVELTYNWDGPQDYSEGRNFGHLAYEVDDIYALCSKLQGAGVTINRPPKDGRMAFIRSPDQISIEFLQKGDPLPPSEPWISMPNIGHW